MTNNTVGVALFFLLLVLSGFKALISLKIKHLRPTLTDALEYLADDFSVCQDKLAISESLQTALNARIWRYQGYLWLLGKEPRDYWRSRLEAYEQIITRHRNAG